MQSWWTASDPGDALGLHKAAWTSVKVPKTGTKVQVKGDTKKDWSSRRPRSVERQSKIQSARPSPTRAQPRASTMTARVVEFEKNDGLPS